MPATKLLYTILLACIVSTGTHAALTIDVTPPEPTIYTPVSLYAWREFPDPAQEFVSATYSILELQINMQVYMQDLHEPGKYYPQVITPEGGSVDVGTLAAGDYQVNAVMYMYPWGSSFPGFLDSGTGSFTVIPEPSGLVTLVCGLGGLGGMLRRRRT